MSICANCCYYPCICGQEEAFTGKRGQRGPRGPEGEQGPIGPLALVPFGLGPLNYTLQITHYEVPEDMHFIEFGNGNQVATLPPTTGTPGEAHVIKKSGTGTLSIAASGDDTIDGQILISINQWDSVTLFSNGTAWLLV